MKPSHKGSLQRHNAGFFLTPDSATSIQDFSGIVRILGIPMLRRLIEGLKKLVEVLPFQLVGDIHQNLLLHFKLNLAGLPDLRITEEMLAALIQPFIEKVKEVHTEIMKKI